METKETITYYALHYFIGIRMNFIKKTLPGPHQEKSNAIFIKVIDCLKLLIKENPNLDCANLTTTIYTLLIQKVITPAKIKQKKSSNKLQKCF